MADRRTDRFFNRLKSRFSSDARSTPASPAIVRQVARRAGHSMFLEALESRRLMTTLAGGGMTTDAAGLPIAFASPSVEFRMGGGTQDDSIIRVTLYGNIVAEFIGVPRAGNVPQDMVVALPVVTDPAQVVPGVTMLVGTGADLYAIYIAQSDPNASITISTVAEFNTTGAPRPALFNDPGPQIRVNPAGGGQTILVNPGVGSAYIGTRTASNITAPGNSIPVNLSIPITGAFGVRPDPAVDPTVSSTLSAGIQSAPGQSLKKFIIAGAVTGRVELGGSIDQFYAGAILTGDVGGIGTGNAVSTLSPSQPALAGTNFIVAGDAHQIITPGALGGVINGTGVTFKSGAVVEVGGRLGAVDATQGSIASYHVRNDSSVTGSGLDQTEVESKQGTFTGEATYLEPGGIAEPELGGAGNFAQANNDTIQTAQYLGTARNAVLRNNDIIQLAGAIEGVPDTADFYAVALMAGQTATAQITSLFGTQLGILDPDNVLIASDASNNGASNVGGQLRFTAKKAGVYYFRATGGADYVLTVSGVGTIALGGLVSQGTITSVDTLSNDLTNLGGFADTVRVDRGDLGAIQSEGGSVVSVSPSYDVDGSFLGNVIPYTVTRGNLRSIQGVSVGLLDINENPVSAPEINVPRGAVGLVRSTGGVVAINSGIALGNSDIAGSASTVGSYQMIDASGNFASNIATRGGVGVIRANIVNTISFAGRWALNTDESGSDGILDLVEARTSFGTATAGGPGISTGIGGNVRYIRVGTGSAAPSVFRDSFFGLAQQESTTYLPGTVLNLTDDNGTTYRLAADPIAFDNTIPTAPVQVGAGIWTITQYAIRDKGGSVLIDARLASTDATTRGIRVVSNKVGRGSSVEIGYLLNQTADAGVTSTYDPLTRTFTVNDIVDPTTGAVTAVTNNITLTGKSPIDIYQLDSLNGGAPSGIRNIDNKTTGEIVNINASNIFSLTGETFGYARSTWGAEVSGSLLPQNAFPFTDYHTLINVAGGNIVTASSRGAMGPLFARNLGTITADSDGIRHSGVFEGIIYPLYAISTAAGDASDGNIVKVNVGQGLLPSGTGNFVGGGIYADRQVVSVEANNADIRGDIVSQGIDLGTILANPDTTIINTRVENFIESVRVRNGSIIDADILASSLASSLESSGFIVGGRPGDFNNPQYDIGDIRVDGNGGIIGTEIIARNIDRVEVNGGFGILNTNILSAGDGIINRVITDGYGIQSVNINGGGSVNTITARGNGARVSTAKYNANVRYSESRRGQIDPYFGFAPNANTDLNVFLGTTASSPNLRGVTEQGQIKNSLFVGTQKLGTVTAHRITGDNAAGLSFNDPAFPMRISFGQGIGTIKTTDAISGLTVVGGSLDNFAPGNDVYFSRVSITGKIKAINAAGSLRGSSAIAASGPNGSIDSFIVGRGLYSPVTVGSNLTKLQVGKDIGTTVNVGEDLGTLTVGNSILTGSTINVGGTIKNLGIRRDLQDNSTIRADAITTQTIGGQVLGDIIIT